MSSDKGDDPLSTGGAFEVLSGLGGRAEDALAGRRLGDYEIVDVIASGGMGRVYRGRRADGKFERDVAIKVTATGSLNAELLARFRQEQAVLAALNHPNICQLYDAGVTEEGWPFIIMELVDGESIVDYCRRLELPLDERLRLMIDVVRAVAYAHRHLIVHRDIKPANVFVNAEGQVKLLDFGIAKLLESEEVLTRAPVLTPRYASPEQLLGQPVTISSDIAQIGLLLYEVLAETPLAGSETLAEAIRRTAENRTPSLDTRHTEKIPGELRPVIEQCLRIDPAERYSDANSLRADLEAFRNGYPVSAVGQSATYRFGKFVRRNAAVALTVVLATAGLVSSAAWYTLQLREARNEAEAQAVAAEREAEKANEIADFFVNMFIEASPRTAKGEDVLLTDVIDKGIERIRTDLDDKPELRASLLFAIAGVQNDLGFYESASELIDESIAEYERLGLEDPVPYGLALYRRGILDWETGDLRAALDPLREGLARFRQSDSDDARYWEAWITNTLGMVASQLNDFETALDYHRQSLEARKAYFGEDDFQVAASLANTAAVYTKQGRHRQALPYYEEAYEKAISQLDPLDPQISRLAMSLGRAYLVEDRFADAERLLTQAADIEREVWGETNVNYSYALLNLAVLEHERENYAEAIRLLTETLDIQLAAFGPGNWDVGATKYRLGTVYLDMGQHEEAATLLAAADATMRDVFPDGHRYYAYIGAARARLLEETRRTDEAIVKYREALDYFGTTVGSDHADSIEPRLRLARLVLDVDGADAAEPLYDEAFEVIAANESAAPEWTPYTDPYIRELRRAGREAAAADVSRRLEGLANR
ncbi:MAG: serine/threonine-protein kinase [Woeseiaceae bacterium]|jgi:serine/threonine-protein kinase|nr:serine/threonine-protein kinase [Woeseiaceae bacterium]